MWDVNFESVGQIAIRTCVVYVLLLVGIRLTGKRQIGQVTPFDLVVLLLVSNAVQNAMTGPDTTIVGGLTAAVVLLAINKVVAIIRLRSSKFQRFVEGVPIVLIQNGEVQHANLKHEEITLDELNATLREHDVDSVDRVELAMLEIDGTISVISRIDDGRLVKTTTDKPT